MHVVLFNNRYINRYNAQLAISCLHGSVGRTREYCTPLFLSSALFVRTPYATFIIVTIEKTIFFIFIKFAPFVISFVYFNKFDLFGDTNILSLDP